MLSITCLSIFNASCIFTLDVIPLSLDKYISPMHSHLNWILASKPETSIEFIYRLFGPYSIVWRYFAVSVVKEQFIHILVLQLNELIQRILLTHINHPTMLI